MAVRYLPALHARGRRDALLLQSIVPPGLPKVADQAIVTPQDGRAHGAQRSNLALTRRMSSGPKGMVSTPSIGCRCPGPDRLSSDSGSVRLCGPLRPLADRAWRSWFLPETSTANPQLP
jgi:hypothetical protein